MKKLIIGLTFSIFAFMVVVVGVMSVNGASAPSMSAEKGMNSDDPIDTFVAFRKYLLSLASDGATSVMKRENFALLTQPGWTGSDGIIVFPGVPTDEVIRNANLLTPNSPAIAWIPKSDFSVMGASDACASDADCEAIGGQMCEDAGFGGAQVGSGKVTHLAPEDGGGQICAVKCKTGCNENGCPQAFVYCNPPPDEESDFIL